LPNSLTAVNSLLEVMRDGISGPLVTVQVLSGKICKSAPL